MQTTECLRQACHARSDSYQVDPASFYSEIFYILSSHLHCNYHLLLCHSRPYRMARSGGHLYVWISIEHFKYPYLHSRIHQGSLLTCLYSVGNESRHHFEIFNRRVTGYFIQLKSKHLVIFPYQEKIKIFTIAMIISLVA